MEMETDQLAIKRDQIKKEIAYWNEVLAKSEKYERLMQDQDFKDILLDIGDVIKLHQAQIDIGMESLSQLPVQKTDQQPNTLPEVQHAILIHQIKKEYAEAAAKRPHEVVDLAKVARRNIPELEEQLKQIKEILHG